VPKTQNLLRTAYPPVVVRADGRVSGNDDSSIALESAHNVQERRLRTGVDLAGRESKERRAMKGERRRVLSKARGRSKFDKTEFAEAEAGMSVREEEKKQTSSDG